MKNHLDLLQPANAVLCAALVLLSLTSHSTRVAALSCPPCDTSLCPQLNCQYGRLLDLCLCCYECAKGPGEICGGIWGRTGFCTNGTSCMVSAPFGSSCSTFIHAKGYCIPDKVSTTTSLPMPTSTIAVEPISSTMALIPTPIVTPLITPEPIRKKYRCRMQCSVDFCSDGKNKMCSANMTGYELVEGRHPCQHTTCRACRLMVAPTHCPECPVPLPTKRCLRSYFLCLENHLKRDDVLLELHDFRALTAKGQIICHIPKVPQTIEGSASGDGGNQS